MFFVILKMENLWNMITSTTDVIIHHVWPCLSTHSFLNVARTNRSCYYDFKQQFNASFPYTEWFRLLEPDNNGPADSLMEYLKLDPSFHSALQSLFRRFLEIENYNNNEYKSQQMKIPTLWKTNPKSSKKRRS